MNYVVNSREESVFDLPIVLARDLSIHARAFPAAVHGGVSEEILDENIREKLKTKGSEIIST